MISWAFLVVSLYGAWFTYNAYRPSRRWQLLTLSFFAGWLTSELALFHIAWQVVATIVFISLDALDRWAGIVGLAITIASWLALVWIQFSSRRARQVMEAALRDGLGDDYRAEIEPGLAERLTERVSLREVLFPFWLRDGRVARTRGLRYAPGGGRRHELDVYRPRAGVERAPVLFQIHGGAWVVGDKGQQALPLMLHLAARGWVCVAANYRLSPRATWPDHLVDCKLALAWIREHIAEYGGDPDFVVVTGGSAGGHLAAMIALTAGETEFQPGFEHVDTSVTACVPFYGVYDVAQLFEIQGGPRRWSAGFEKSVMGVSLDRDRDRFVDASPIAHVREDAPVFFVIHGDTDNLVPVTQAREFVERLRAVSREPVLYAEIPGAGHAFEVFRSLRTAHVINGADRFLAWLYSAHRARHPEAPADPMREVAGHA